MKATLEKIESLRVSGLFDSYAIGGGIAHFYYIEAGTTYDLDVMVQMNVPTSGLISLGPIYEWAKKNGYEVSEEHIVIEGIPVQFLPAFNPIIVEAIENAERVELFGVQTFIMKPEYLMTIMLDTYRAKDRERLGQFMVYVPQAVNRFELLLKKFDLLDKYSTFKKTIS